ncbi:MAG TPA: hypothetical protein VII75_01725 [Thermoanaerobaculia bacterium]|nr:hypothetical protein [Thermoanaerobaculia bacterium]
MGVALWLLAGGTACILGRFIRKLRQHPAGEWIVALLSSLILGVIATALDFGGWRELDWRAGLFVFVGSFSAIGFYRTIRGDPMKRIATAVSALVLFSTCAAYHAQHTGTDSKTTRPEEQAKQMKADPSVTASFEAQPLALKQAILISELDRYTDELKSNGKYDCCVKPGCRECVIRAGECHCRKVIDANGPCCGECTQSWIEGRGNTAGVDRQKVLEHLGCVRELYEKKP